MTDSDLSIASSAKRITELAQTSALADADLLAVERPGDSTYSTALGLIKELVSQKADDELGFGTAAYTEPCEYAPLAHAHDYSDFDFFPSYRKDDGTATV